MTRLIDAYTPWFARIQAFVGQPQGDAAEVATRVDAWLSQARSAAASASCPPEHAELAAFAAAAWADERLQTSSWEHAGQWHAHLLQRRHFGVVDAGEAFFRHLRELGPEQQEVREVFAMALLLGLRGRHALDPGDTAWRQARDAQLAHVLGEPAERSVQLLVHRHGPSSAAAPRRWQERLHSLWVVGAAATIALAVLFGTYSWLLHQALGAWFSEG